jgi:hypothetical protein
MATTTLDRPSSTASSVLRKETQGPRIVPFSSLDLIPPEHMIVDHNSPMAAMKGVVLGFGGVLRLRSENGISKIEIDTLSYETMDASKRSTAISECICRARARGENACVDASSLIRGKMLMDGVSSILEISSEAKAVGLKVVFDNVPQSIVEKMRQLRIVGAADMGIPVGSSLPETKAA